MPKARFLNKDKVIERLTNLAVKAKARNKDIDKIILFGSLVNDTYTSLSDADLLIVLKKSDSRIIDRIPSLLYLFADAPIAVDIFPYTEDEIASIPFAQKAVAGGIVIC